MFGNEKILKCKLSETLWERLNFHARQTNVELEIAAERILERYLPNLMGSFSRIMEMLSQEEQSLLEESFHAVLFIVSYADEHASRKELRMIERQLQDLKETFGKQLVQALDISKERKEKLLETIKMMSVEEIQAKLESIRDVFLKLPAHLLDEFKIALLDSCIAVANASKANLLAEESISDEERKVLQTIVNVFEIPILGRHAKVLMRADFHSLKPTVAS